MKNKCELRKFMEIHSSRASIPRWLPVSQQWYQSSQMNRNREPRNEWVDVDNSNLRFVPKHRILQKQAPFPHKKNSLTYGSGMVSSFNRPQKYFKPSTNRYSYCDLVCDIWYRGPDAFPMKLRMVAEGTSTILQRAQSIGPTPCSRARSCRVQKNVM